MGKEEEEEALPRAVAACYPCTCRPAPPLQGVPGTPGMERE